MKDWKMWLIAALLMERAYSLGLEADWKLAVMAILASVSLFHRMMCKILVLVLALYLEEKFHYTITHDEWKGVTEKYSKKAMIWHFTGKKPEA